MSGFVNRKRRGAGLDKPIVEMQWPASQYYPQIFLKSTNINIRFSGKYGKFGSEYIC